MQEGHCGGTDKNSSGACGADMKKDKANDVTDDSVTDKAADTTDDTIEGARDAAEEENGFLQDTIDTIKEKWNDFMDKMDQ